MQWWGIRQEEWEHSSGTRKAWYIAVYRLKHRLDAVLAWAEAKEARRKARSPRGASSR